MTLRERTVILGAAFALLAAGAAGLATAGSASATPAGLTVSIADTKTWTGGYQDTATIANPTAAPISGWTVQFQLTAGMSVTSYWRAAESGTASQGTFTFTALSYDATIPAGGSTTFGFQGADPAGYSAPTNVSINGVGGGGSPTGSPTATATGTPTGPPTGSPTATATGGPTGPAGGESFAQADIDAAVAAPLITFAAPTSGVPRPGTNPTDIYESKVLYYLALVDLEDPGAKATGGTTVDAALLAQVGNLVSGGREPDADGGLEGWSAAAVAQALLLVRHGPAWPELGSAGQSKVSLLMAAMGYGGNYAYNDANDFSSGICGFGNFAKTNNPNYEDGYVDVELAVIEYFGAGTWDGMLAGFDDATEAAALDAAGLTNAGGCFGTVGSAANAAIQHAWLWKGHAASDAMGIWSQLAADTFDLTVTSSVTGTSNGVNVTARIADGSTSPEQGRLGMGKEFDSTDSGGLRSSALYVYEGWMNVTASRVALAATGAFQCSAATSAAQYKVGTADLIYKLDHGYTSYAASQSGVLVDDKGDPSSDGPVAKGWNFDDDAYAANVPGQSC
ncbi:MAG TPA: cellulose binding domain-containing protein [Actinospica sp.]|nr:cellulose binding domain-containing protein [Actinospica sp.]